MDIAGVATTATGTHVIENRKHLSTHPWLRFEIDLRPALPSLWIMLGECQSKCEHLAGVPLRPDVNRKLHAIYLAKGVAATTAIEGNTLSEEQVRQQIEGTLTVPPSKEYLKQEVENILEGCNMILAEIAGGTLPPLSVERVKLLNEIVLKKLNPSDDQAVPGQIRSHSVGVMDYRGAPAEDCEHLVGRLCAWLNGMSFPEEQETVGAIIKAILAHLYLAWIHPFGDGNGRTARLLEVQILLGSGVPSPAAQLLSNHYNQTRSEYYRQLSRASKSGGNVIPFLEYAVQGFRDGLREQIAHVQSLQWEIAWQAYVHETFQHRTSEADNRRMRLMLEVSTRPVETAIELIPTLPGLVADYHSKTAKTLSRDVNALQQLGLLSKHGNNVRARKEVMLAFLPTRLRKP